MLHTIRLTQQQIKDILDNYVVKNLLKPNQKIKGSAFKLTNYGGSIQFETNIELPEEVK